MSATLASATLSVPPSRRRQGFKPNLPRYIAAAAKQDCTSKSDSQSRISGAGECGHITHGHSTPTLAQRLVGGVTCPCSILPTYSIGCAVRRATCTHTRFALYRSIRHSLTASAQSPVCFLTQKRRLSLKRPVKGQRGSNSHCARRLTPKLRLPRTAHQARQYEQITVGGRGGSSPYVEETTFLHNADAYRLSPSAYSPTANLCSNCRACHAAASALRFGQSHRTHWPRTMHYIIPPTSPDTRQNRSAQTAFRAEGLPLHCFRACRAVCPWRCRTASHTAIRHNTLLRLSASA